MKKIRILILLMMASKTLNAVIPVAIPRSQSVNLARETVGWQYLINLCDMEEIYGAFAVIPEFTQTFRAGRLANEIFGADASCSRCDGTIAISGSAVANRGNRDWLADYFGLPRDFQSTLTFKPRIQNFLVDFDFYLGLDEMMCGLYLFAHVPLVHTRWNLHASEKVINQGSLGYPAGYFQGDATPRENLLTNALDFFSGVEVPLINDANATCLGNSFFQPLKFSKFPALECTGCKTTLTKTRFADFEFGVGWNFFCDDKYLLGLSIRASAPLGNTPEGYYLFEPIVGDGHHWKLGFGVNAQAIFWSSEDEDSNIGVFFDGRMQHLFKHCQTRTLDLCGRPNSRYMLAQRLGTVRNTPQIDTATAADAGVEWQQEFTPVANLTTHNVAVEMYAELDAAIKLSWLHNNLTCDLGYEVWYRTCERLSRKPCCVGPALDGKSWALKGDAYVVGFAQEFPGECQKVRLAATESLATIHQGTNNGAMNNPNIDNAILLSAANAGNNIFDAPVGGVLTHSSNPVVFLRESDENLAGSSGFSNKIFANISHAWTECEDWTPFIGIGGEVEFGVQGSCKKKKCQPAGINTCDCNCDGGSCSRLAISEWGIWLKGGFSFN